MRKLLLALLLLIGMARPSFAAITYVNSAGSASTNSFGATLTLTTTATASVGQFMILNIYRANLGAVTTIVDGGLNTYTESISEGTAAMSVFCAPITTQDTSGSTITITFTSAQGNSRSVVADIFAGLNNCTPDKTNTNTGFGASATPGSTGTLTNSGELAYHAVVIAGTVTPVAAANYAITASQAGGGTTVSEYYVVPTTTAQNPALTWTGNQSWFSVVATYNAAATSSATPCRRLLLGVGGC